MKIGYLKADNAEYDPAFMVIRKELDPIEDALRIKNETNWVSPKIQGVLGTNPLNFKLLDVIISDGGDKELFKKGVNCTGGWYYGIAFVYETSKGRI